MNASTPDSEANKHAWDTLYRKTAGSVWGSEPIPFVREFLDELSSEIDALVPILDAASGDGRHLPVLLETAGAVHSCDASAAAIEKQGQHHNGAVLKTRCDLAETPYEDGQFQFISLIDTIETLPDPEPALREMHRILRPGGKLLCNIPGEEDEISSEEMNPLQPDSAPAGYLYQDTYFYRFYSESDALALVERCGFGVVRNEIRHWRERAHPGFRDYDHDHTSRVLLLVRP